MSSRAKDVVDKNQKRDASRQVILMSFDYPLCAIEILILWSRALSTNSRNIIIIIINIKIFQDYV